MHYNFMDELKEGNVYSLEQIRNYIGVSLDKWKKKRNEILMYFENYYEYEIRYNDKDRRKREVLIIKKICDWQKYSSEAKKKSEKRDKILEENIVDIIDVDNIQTSANVNRIIRRDVKYIEETYTEGTSYEYVRKRMIEYFGKRKGNCGTKGRIVGKVWCKLDRDYLCYHTLDDDVVNEYRKLLKETGKSDDIINAELDLVTDYENGTITKEEYDNLCGDLNFQKYQSAKKKFYDKFGFYPVCVPMYEFNFPIVEGAFNF